VRIESSVTSVSWIPSAAVTGATRIPFERGVTHYDDPSPDQWKDLDSVLGPEGARFANNLRAWLEVEDGKIVGYGQGGGGRVSSTLLRLGGMRVVVEAVSYPELTPEPGDRTVMQARKESLWRHLLGVVYALTVVFTPGEGQLSGGLGATSGSMRR